MEEEEKAVEYLRSLSLPAAPAEQEESSAIEYLRSFNAPTPVNTTTLDVETGRVLQHNGALSASEASFWDQTSTGLSSVVDYIGFEKMANPLLFLAGVQEAPVSVSKGIGAGVTEVVGSVLSGTMQQVGQEQISRIEGKTQGFAERVGEASEALRKIEGTGKGIREFLAEVGEAVSPSLVVADMQKALADKGLIDEQDLLVFNEGIIEAGRSIQNGYKDMLLQSGMTRPEDNPIGKVLFDVGSGMGSMAAVLGAAVVTKSAAAAGILGGAIQQNQTYIEATEAGLEFLDAKRAADISGVTTTALEAVGTKVALSLFQTGKAFGRLFNKSAATISTKVGLKTAAAIGTEEAAVETVDFLIQSEDLADVGVRERLTTEEKIKEGLYTAGIAFFSGGTTSAAIGAVQNYANKQKLDKAVVDTMVAEVKEVLAPSLRDEFQSVLQQEANVVNQRAPDREVARVFKDLSEGRRIQIEKILSQNKELTSFQKQKILDKFKSTAPRDLEVELRINEFDEKLYRLDSKIEKTALDLEKRTEEKAPVAQAEAALDRLLIERDAIVKTRDELLAARPVIPKTNPVLSFRAKRLSALGVRADEKTEQAVNKSFREAKKLAVSDMQSAQRALVDAINAAKLSDADRAKFLKTLPSIKSSDQLLKKTSELQARIARFSQKQRRSSLRKKISKQAKIIKNANVTDVLAIQELDMILRKVEAKGLFDESSNLSASELEDILLEVSSLKEDAASRLETRKELRKARFERRLNDLRLNGVKPLTVLEIPQPEDIGGRLGLVDQVRSLLIPAINKWHKIGVYKNPMDVIFDIQDGVQDFNGPTHRIFKQAVDASHSKYLNHYEEITRPVKEVVSKLKLKRKNLDRVGVYAALQQENGRKKLLKYFTEQQLDRLENSMTDAEMQYYNTLRRQLDKLIEPVRQTLANVYNKDFKEVKNYFPMLTDFDSMTGAEMQDMFGPDVVLLDKSYADASTSDVKKNFTKERVGSRQRLRIDSLNVFLSHADNATYFVNMAQDIKELSYLASSSRYLKIAGNLGQEIAVDYLNLLARKGNLPDRIKAVDMLRENVSGAILGYKLGTTLLQFTAFGDGAAKIGSVYMNKGVTAFSTSKEWRKFLLDNMPEIRDRVGDDPSYLNLGGGSALKKARDAGFWGMQKIDTYSASSVAIGGYLKSIEERGLTLDFKNPDPTAIRDAQLMARRSQSSPFQKDAPPLISQGKLTGNSSLDKLIFSFQSFVFNRWSLIEHEGFRNLGKGKTVEAFNAFLWIAISNAAELSIRHWSKIGLAFAISLLLGKNFEIEEHENEEAALVQTAKQAVSNVPFVSSLVSSAEYGSVPIPAVSFISQATEALSRSVNAATEEARIRNAIQFVFVASGAAGAPGALQASQVTKEVLKE